FRPRRSRIQRNWFSDHQAEASRESSRNRTAPDLRFVWTLRPCYLPPLFFEFDEVSSEVSASSDSSGVCSSSVCSSSSPVDSSDDWSRNASVRLWRFSLRASRLFDAVEVTISRALFAKSELAKPLNSEPFPSPSPLGAVMRPNATPPATSRAVRNFLDLPSAYPAARSANCPALLPIGLQCSNVHWQLYPRTTRVAKGIQQVLINSRRLWPPYRQSSASEADVCADRRLNHHPPTLSQSRRMLVKQMF